MSNNKGGKSKTEGTRTGPIFPEHIDKLISECLEEGMEFVDIETGQVVRSIEELEAIHETHQTIEAADSSDVDRDDSSDKR